MGVQIAFDFFSDPPAAQASAAPRADATLAGGGTAGASAPERAAPDERPGAASGPVLDAGDPDARPRPVPRLGTLVTKAPPVTGVAGEGARAELTRASLEAQLRARTDLPLRLHLSDNERTMISTRRSGSELVVRLHHMFLAADHETLSHLCGYLDKSDSRAGEHLGAFIARHRDRIRRRGPRRMRLRPIGEHHDLRAIYQHLNAEYFDDSVQARITWARRTSAHAGRTAGAGRKRTGSRRSIKLGSYCWTDSLIRVHPVLDADWVPEFFVAYIVYHEMLHQAVPPRETDGRRNYHSREFRTRERRFCAYDEAIAWEQANLSRLLRA